MLLIPIVGSFFLINPGSAGLEVPSVSLPLTEALAVSCKL